MRGVGVSTTCRLLCITLIANEAIARETLVPGHINAHNPFLHSTNTALSGGKPRKLNSRGTFFSNRNVFPPSNMDGNDIILRFRGGACADSNPILLIKIAISAMLETTLMTSLILFSQNIATKYPEKSTNIFGLPVITWLSLISIIFASSFFGSIVDGGLSAATRQVLDPNAIAGDADWYDKLIKPSWNPPGWLFPIMWLIVSKPTQLVSVATLLKRNINSKQLPLLLIAYCAHLSLGDAWNKVFFGLQCKGLGAVVISKFYAMLLLSTYLFSTADKTAGLFMLPTCGWVTVATALNWNIYLANKN